MVTGQAQDTSLTTKLALVENLLWVVDKDAQLCHFKLNQAQKYLFSNWSHRMILCKSRQLGISTATLALFFIEAQLIPGLVVAIVSHEEYATRRLLDKVDIYHKNLPKEMQSKMFHNSDNEKVFENGSTMYIGTAGQRAFGRGDTIHRAHVSEEAHYTDAEKLLSGLAEAVPMSGYLVRESTPLGDSGHFYSSVQDCIEGKSDYKLLPFYWWLCDDYRIPRNSPIVMEEERGELTYTQKEAMLVFAKKLDEEQIRWRRWKIRSMRSEAKGNLFPQEYIEDLESCWLGPPDKVFSEVDEQLQEWSLNAKDPARTEGILEIWKEPEPGAKYIFWVDPAGGESPTEGDPHDGVVLRLHAGGLEHVASIQSRMDQKALAYKVAEIATKYNIAMLVVERNGVGRGVLNYLVNDISYKNLYPERKPDGELSGRYGWNTDHPNKSLMISNAIAAIKSNGIISYDRKLVRQLKALTMKNGKVISTIHDDRAMSFMGAISVTHQGTFSGSTLSIGDYVSWKK